MIGRRPLGRSGVDVGEIGLVLRWNGAAGSVARRAVELGCTVFRIEGDEDEARGFLERLNPDLLMLSRGNGGEYRLETAGGRGAVRLAGVDVPSATPGTGGRAFVMASYNLIEQGNGLRSMPEASRTGLGVVAADVLAGGALRGPVVHVPSGAAVEKYRFLVRPRRTFTQAAVQFVLANEYVSCALVEASSLPEAEEILASPCAEPLNMRELENIFENWAGRCDGG